MLIGPANAKLTAEVRISPAEIDRIRLNQASKVRFPAFDMRTTPEVDGRVTRIGADLTSEPRTGQSFYLVHVEVEDEARRVLGEHRLLPGMPVEAFIETGQRTALSYIVKPLRDQLARALKER
jgi:HlyD family secretion protein